MSDDAAAAPAGWYPDPGGEQRYWDGTGWLSLPDPASSSTSEAANLPNKKIPKRSVYLLIGLLVVVGIAGGTWKMLHDSRIDDEKHAAQAATDAAAASAVAAAQEQERVAAAAKATQDRADSATRSLRTASVTDVEARIKTMAEGHVKTGLIDGPILAVSCSPVGGGSTDDLTASTTVFECFASNKDNGDGTQSGYKYHATMNWTTGGATWGFGAP